MKIRTRLATAASALVALAVGLTTVAVIRVQRQALEADARLRLESIMDGVERLGQESLANKDELMLLSYLMLLQKERQEFAWGTATYNGHTSQVGTDEPGLVYFSRSVSASRSMRSGVLRVMNSTGTATADMLYVRLGFREELLRAEIDRALKPLLAQTVRLGGLFIVLGLLGSVWLAQRITSPILVLTGAIESLGEGRLDARVRERGPVEVKVLAHRFNTMAARVKDLVEFREDILHALTHDIKTPLAGLKSHLELWAERGLSKDPALRRADMEAFVSAVSRMENSLADALRLFRSPEGETLEQSKLIAIHEIIEEVIVLFLPVAHAKNIDLQHLPSKMTGSYYGPEEPLRQIITNLLSNALKFTPDGGRIHCGISDMPHEVQFSVSDTGYGIPPDDLPHLFTRFYRSEAGRHRRIPGTGLGLALARRAVESLGGTIRVESQVNKGSTFTVTFPKKDLPTEDA